MMSMPEAWVSARTSTPETVSNHAKGEGNGRGVIASVSYAAELTKGRIVTLPEAG
jgi:hypothetical protein